ncbi:hypothetical protein [Paralcaligenes ureilyticus]|uniref:Uncharacterized protein n=1 Tax=Paralcaligenes ureilyticus TaxID=627131 RepID=A0A4R3MAZ7_9BURK|nr:hypothetical protein [Paralcaligenes ureilyticus]TCT10312.1 hypothetical protein EDC26_102268 [Paralcaligenes ureilyticus]
MKRSKLLAALIVTAAAVIGVTSPQTVLASSYPELYTVSNAVAGNTCGIWRLFE